MKVMHLNNFACISRRKKEIVPALNSLDEALRILYENKEMKFRGLTSNNMGALLSQIGE
jgi:hypothetical protein